jgi:Gram-negative bacterial TonB protein C-terminal
MKKFPYFLLIIVLLLSFTSLHAQTISNVTDSLGSFASTPKTDQQIVAKFPGGPKAWGQYLGHTVDFKVPVRKKAPAGTYNVIVRFSIDKDGTLSNFVAETNFGYGMEEEVIRVLKKSPHWTPASQNGQYLNENIRQPVIFTVN